jgi:hypothetical protein
MYIFHHVDRMGHITVVCVAGMVMAVTERTHTVQA